MRILYEGTDITPYAEAVEAVVYDRAGDQADGLRLVLQNAGKWYAWKPQTDDTIEVTQDGYTSGRLYLDTVYPEEGQYKVIATAVPAAARLKRWQSFEHHTLREILAAVAAACSMEYSLFGLEGSLRYPYLLRKNETAAGFLRRVLRLEGAALKCTMGKFVALGIEACQRLEVRRELMLSNGMPGLEHRRTDSEGYAGLRIVCPWGTGYASDTAMEGGRILTVSGEPAPDAITASRWARGILLHENQQRERLTLAMGFDPGITAMLPVRMGGEAALQGVWLTEAVEQDLINQRTRSSFFRCVETIR